MAENKTPKPRTAKQLANDEKLREAKRSKSKDLANQLPGAQPEIVNGYLIKPFEDRFIVSHPDGTEINRSAYSYDQAAHFANQEPTVD